MSEERATTIFDADNTKLLAAAREVDAAIERLGSTAKASSSASVTGNAKMAEGAAKASTAVGKVTSNFAATGLAAKTAADSIQGIIGKASGYLAIAGAILGVTTAIVTATIEWYKAQEEVEKKIVAARKMRYDAENAELALIEQDTEEREGRQWKGRVTREANLKKVADARVEASAAALDREAQLIQAAGGSQKKSNALLQEALKLRLSILDVQTTEGFNQRIALTHQADMIKAGEKKSSGPSAAQRLSEQLAAEADSMEASLERFEALGIVNRTTQRDALELAKRRRDLARYQLEDELRVLDATKAYSEQARYQLDLKKFTVAQKLEAHALEEQIALRKESDGLVQQAAARATAAVESEVTAVERLNDERTRGAERHVANLEASGASGAAIHAAKMEQLRIEAEAQERTFAAKSSALSLSSSSSDDPAEREAFALQKVDDIKQLVHERDMERLDAGLQMRQAVAEESKRIAEEQKAELERQLSTISEVTSAVESVASNLAGKLGEFASMRMEQEAAELEQYTAGLEARGRQQSAALDREIAQARGNAARLAKLQEQKRKLEESTGKAIEKAKADHAAKADKIERVQKGTSMLLTGAQEVVETAAAYPNPVSMAAHAVAAALAFGFGAAVLAGGTPGAGGGGGAASMGGGSSSGGSNVEFGEAAKTPGSLGTSAGTAPKLAQTSSANGSTVFNGPVTFNSNGSIDRAAAESIALESGKAARSREGAGRT
jgi:hypothetical protein